MPRLCSMRSGGSVSYARVGPVSCRVCSAGVGGQAASEPIGNDLDGLKNSHESQGRNLAVAVLYVPYLLDTNLETLAPKDPLSPWLLADTFTIQVPLPTHISEVPL